MGHLKVLSKCYVLTTPTPTFSSMPVKCQGQPCNALAPLTIVTGVAPLLSHGHLLGSLSWTALPFLAPGVLQSPHESRLLYRSLSVCMALLGQRSEAGD